MGALQALGAIAGMIFAYLAWSKGRENKRAIAANTELTAKTQEAVNGQGARLEAVAHATGYRQGVIDQAGGAAPAPYPPPEP